MLPLLFALQSAAPDSGLVYNGLAKRLDARLPRFEAEAKIDGVLDEPMWRRAARLTGFSQYRPVDGRPAEDSTEVLAWYAPDAIYFGIRAFERHGTVVRANVIVANSAPRSAWSSAEREHAMGMDARMDPGYVAESYSIWPGATR